MIQLKKKYGALWQLIFYHDISGGLFDANTALVSNEEKRFSAIGMVTSSFKQNNYYEYLLEYPSFSGYNRWQQKITIADTTSSQTKEDIGYKKIHVDFSEKDWGGIARSSQSQTIFDGSPGVNGNYWYSIGATQYYCNKIQFPGLCYASNTDGVQNVSLWIRIPQKYQCTFKYRNYEANRFALMLIALLIS